MNDEATALLARLPHRPPFLLLDRVLACDAGSSAVAVKNLSAGDPWMQPGGWPAVLLAEVMAQTAGLAAGGTGAAVVARLDRFRCHGRVLSGDRLIAAARVVRRFGATALVRALVRCNGRRCAAAEIVLRFDAGLPPPPAHGRTE
jgi:3-hydroxyacyl-[acyl-carrier-protein] dehydratase